MTFLSTDKRQFGTVTTDRLVKNSFEYERACVDIVSIELKSAKKNPATKVRLNEHNLLSG